MTHAEETGWAKIQFRQSVDELRQYGPTIGINVAASVDGAMRMNALAQIDTGAAGTGISARLALMLGLEAIDKGEVHHPGRPPIMAPYFRVRLFLPGAEIDF